MKIPAWFRRNNLIMIQAIHLQGQLQDAWDEKDYYIKIAEGYRAKHEYVAKQLHRVARERDIVLEQLRNEEE